jgi:hypothetical protein
VATDGSARHQEDAQEASSGDPNDGQANSGASQRAEPPMN